MGKRIATSILGIPIWVITGLALFILFSAIYDWIVRDVSYIRYGLMISAILIIIITIAVGFVKKSYVAKQARKQMGG